MALSYCAGIWLDSAAAFSPTALILSILLSILAAILAAFYFRRMAFAAGILTALFLGASVHAARFRIQTADDVASLTPERASFAWVRGRIVEAEWRPSRTLNGGRAYVSAQRVAWIVAVDSLGQNPAELRGAIGKIRVSVRTEIHLDDSASADDKSNAPDSSNDLSGVLAEGDRVEFRALLEPLPVATIPDGFDYGAYLAGLGVHRVGTVSPATLQKLAGPEWWRIALRLRRFSGELASRTPLLLNGHVEQAGLLNAMVFGRREALSSNDREAFAISGTAHLLAISGLHIQLVCAALWWMLGLFGVSRRKSAGGVFAACLAYCLLTGSSPPAVRATVMFGAYVGASMFQREADPLNALAAAALIVLSYAPQELFSVGFQLSFLAVLSLHVLLPAFEAAWENWRSSRVRNISVEPGEPERFLEIAGRWILKSMLVTLAAWLATSPSVAWHMGRFSTLGLFVNLFALPFLSVCMAFGSATIALGYVWPALGQLLGWGAWLSLSMLEGINAYCAALPGSSIDMPRPIALTLVAYAASLTWLWIARDGTSDIERLRWVVPACPLLLLSNLFFRPAHAGPELTVLDLSHGRAALLETNGGAALVDVGAAGQGLRIVELLRRRGIRKLELLVLTCDQPDALGGALELLPRVAARRVILPRCKFPSEMRRALEALLAEKNIPYGSPSATEELIAPASVRWEFLDDGPPSDLPAANASSLCVRVSCSSFKVLFAEAKSSASLSRLLAKSGTSFEADVLRMTPGEYGRWPRETAELIRRAGCRAIVAGTYANPEEAPGVDFDSLTARVFSPHRDGSIRMSTKSAGTLQFHAFRGEWRELPR